MVVKYLLFLAAFSQKLENRLTYLEISNIINFQYLICHIFNDLFQGTKISQYKCSNCKEINEDQEDFISLLIEIPDGFQQVTIQQCLKFAFKHEINKQCIFKCAKCKMDSHVDKTQKLSILPKILILTLSRFKENDGVNNKDCTSVDVSDKTLDLFEITSQNLEGKNRNTRYHLHGVSHHSGSLDGGHYIAETKDAKSSKWYECNDSEVNMIKEISSGESPYILIYYREDLELGNNLK